jgi:hypothetical protein
MRQVILPFFPVPECGETVYSVFCRFIKRSGLCERFTLQLLTGQRNKNTLLSHLPGYVSHVASRLPIGHPWKNPDYLIRNNSNLSYFTYFDNHAQRLSATHLLNNAKSSLPALMSLGLTQYRRSLELKPTKFCVECVAHDNRVLGFSIFHREHQLPAVGVCWIHGCSLSIGCKKCGAYPLNGRGMSMPGSCQCKTVHNPLPAHPDLPKNKHALMWLAKESASMLVSAGSPHESVYSALRRAAVDQELCRGTLLEYEKIAMRLTERFGDELPAWTGFPVWSGSRPSAWIRKLFRGQSRSNGRKPAVPLLLVLGSLFESVKEFESYAKIAMPLPSGIPLAPTIEEAAPDRRHANIPPGSPDHWKVNLEEELRARNYRISSTACALGISPSLIATAARDQGIRVPLGEQAIRRLGEKKLRAIKTALASGMHKLTIEKKYSVSEWSLLLIQLDDPALDIAWRKAISDAIFESHRKKVTDHIRKFPRSAKTDVMLKMAGTYDHLITKDKEWFAAQFTGVTRPRKSSARRAKDWHSYDKALAGKIATVATDMLKSAEKPRWVTSNLLLEKNKALTRYKRSPGSLPLTTAVLETYVETKEEFLDRKIRWGVGIMAKNDQPISINKLRRVLGMPAPRLRSRKAFVVSCAKSNGAVFAPHSFFTAP